MNGSSKINAIKFGYLQDTIPMSLTTWQASVLYGKQKMQFEILKQKGLQPDGNTFYRSVK